MAEFDPRQLDMLEDALEGLDEIDDLAALELSPELTERLGEYQDVLALCRDAFPIVAPPDELLTEVIAEAHEVSRRPKLRDGLASSSGWRRFWERWRGTLVPGLTLAGTAAAVLLLLDPGDKLQNKTAARTDELARDSKAEDHDADDEEHRDTSERSAPASEREIDKANTDAEPTPEPNQDAVTQELETPTQATAKAHKKAKSIAPEPAPEPAPAPMSKDDTWLNLERGDAARRAGSCDRARTTYEEIIAASSDTQAIARAKAGIGLCFEQDRSDSKAEAWFEDARATGKGIESWINNERDKQPRPGEKKKQHSKKSADLPSPVEAL